jgi:arylsulfatase A-like enzyme
VVVTSDHGEEFMEHGHVQHGWLTEENVRVPLMIRHPGVEGGVRVEARVSHFDLLPTLAALVGLPVPPGLDGRSWLEPLPMGRSLVAVANTDDALLAASLTEGRMKLIVHCGRRQSPELYDLVADPRERSNLAADRPQQVVRLAAELWRRLDVAGCESLAMTPPGRSGDATRGLANDQKEALEALGYLE